jgi:hypothetical protein
VGTWGGLACDFGNGEINLEIMHFVWFGVLTYVRYGTILESWKQRLTRSDRFRIKIMVSAEQQSKLQAHAHETKWAAFYVLKGINDLFELHPELPDSSLVKMLISTRLMIENAAAAEVATRMLSDMHLIEEDKLEGIALIQAENDMHDVARVHASEFIASLFYLAEINCEFIPEEMRTEEYYKEIHIGANTLVQAGPVIYGDFGG